MTTWLSSGQTVVSPSSTGLTRAVTHTGSCAEPCRSASDGRRSPGPTSGKVRCCHALRSRIKKIVQPQRTRETRAPLAGHAKLEPKPPLERDSRASDGSYNARCPACAEQRHDTKGNHLIVFPNGAFGCVAFAGDSPKARKHRRRVVELDWEIQKAMRWARQYQPSRTGSLTRRTIGRWNSI